MRPLEVNHGGGLLGPALAGEGLCEDGHDVNDRPLAAVVGVLRFRSFVGDLEPPGLGPHGELEGASSALATCLFLKSRTPARDGEGRVSKGEWSVQNMHARERE